MSHRGDHTEIVGSFELDKPLDDDTRDIVDGLRYKRLIKRDPDILAGALKISVEECLRLYGPVCELYSGNDNIGVIACCGSAYCNWNCKQMSSVRPPYGRFPWVYHPEDHTFQHDGMEKSYCYVEWLEYLIQFVLEPRGYFLNGYATTFNRAYNGAYNDYSDDDGGVDEEEEGEEVRAHPEDLHGHIKVYDNQIDASHPTWYG